MRLLPLVLSPLVVVGLVSRKLPWCAQREDRFLVDYDVSPHGLSHKLYCLDFMIKDALQWNRTLVLRDVALDPVHNSFKELHEDWAKYFRLDGLTASVSGQPPCRLRVMRLADADPELRSAAQTAAHTVGCGARPSDQLPGDVRVLTRDPSCSGQTGILGRVIDLSPDVMRLAVTIPTSSTVERLAQRIFERFPKGSWFAHVRRQDALFDCHSPCNIPGGPFLLREATSGDGLLPVFHEHIPKGSQVFVATDETRRTNFLPLARDYILRFEGDFNFSDGSRQYPDPHDNYFTFAVTSKVWELFRESTFHKVLVADRKGDAGADVEVCNSASRPHVSVEDLKNVRQELLPAWLYAGVYAGDASFRCNEVWATRLKESVQALAQRNTDGFK